MAVGIEKADVVLGQMQMVDADVATYCNTLALGVTHHVHTFGGGETR